EKLLVLLVGTEAHDALDAGTVVPTAIKQDDFAAGGQMRDISLEIPLRLFPVVRCGQGGYPADPGVEPLRDPLDRAALAGGITSFEDDDDFQFVGDHPVLKLDELALQAQQLPEIQAPVHAVGGLI